MSAKKMDKRVLRALYPDRFSSAKLIDGESGKVSRVSLAPLHRYSPEEEREQCMATGDCGSVRAALPAQPTINEDDEKARSDIETLERLAKIETNIARSTVQGRRRALAQLIQRTGARVLRSDVLEQDSEYNYTNGGYMHQTTEATWDRMQVQAIEKMTQMSTTVEACMRTLQDQVMRDGVKFIRGNVELVPSAEFAEYTETRLQPFAFQCIEAFLQIGVIPVVYELDPVTGQRWPYVPKLGTYVLRVHCVRGATRYRFFWLDESSYSNAWRTQAVRTRDAPGGQLQWVGRYHCDPYNPTRDSSSGGIEDRTVEIFHNMGYDLSADGTVKSKCASALTVVFDRLRSQRARAIAESLSAMPPIATQYDHQAEARQSRNFQQGYYTSALSAPIGTELAGDAITELDLQNRTYERDAASQSRFAQMIRLYEQVSGRDASGELGIARDEYSGDMGGTAVRQHGAVTSDGVPAPWANQYHIASNRVLVNLPPSRMSGDHIHYINQLDDEICGVFGVPRTYLQGTAVRAGTDLVADRLADQVDALRSVISDVLTRVYNSIFLVDDAEELTNALRMRRESLEKQLSGAYIDSPLSLITDEDLYVSEAIRRVRVTFAKRPTHNTDALLTMFAVGGIDQQMLCREMAAAEGFDPTQMCADENEIPLEMRRHLLPQFADYAKLQLQKEQLAMQKEQMRAQRELEHEKLEVEERVAEKQIEAGVEAKGAESAASNESGDENAKKKQRTEEPKEDAKK